MLGTRWAGEVGFDLLFDGFGEVVIAFEPQGLISGGSAGFFVAGELDVDGGFLGGLLDVGAELAEVGEGAGLGDGGVEGGEGGGEVDGAIGREEGEELVER